MIIGFSLFDKFKFGNVRFLTATWTSKRQLISELISIPFYSRSLDEALKGSAWNTNYDSSYLFGS